jgi:hypothetical protein
MDSVVKGPRAGIMLTFSAPCLASQFTHMVLLVKTSSFWNSVDTLERSLVALILPMETNESVP